ncbi:hypothetical protein AC249_AIPGENE616, partial [Exaiptasia diaphana]
TYSVCPFSSLNESSLAQKLPKYLLRWFLFYALHHRIPTSQGVVHHRQLPKVDGPYNTMVLQHYRQALC